ncbi:MAG: MerR family transcriptional regulator [Clostridia bacterium]|nr:MerR family transcriptional regulator [Clostridia bacterium]
MDKNYLIGEFSERSGISKRMLRHYDKLHLFSPIALNEENGYRYYSEDQLVELRKIQFLKDLGFTLATIKELMCKPLNLYEFLELLKDREVMLTKDSDVIKSSLLLLKRSILHLEKQSPSSFPSINQLLDLEGSIMMSVENQDKQVEKVDLKQLMNRDVFVEKIEEVLEKDRNDLYHFITFDIDNFMHVNDFDGYEVGDAVILNVFSIIIHEMKETMEQISDVMLISRLGGDECSIFLKNADHLKVIESVESIFSAIGSFDFASIGCGRPITVSCGITETVKPVHVAQMKDQSFKALIEAKRNGRSQYKIMK